MKESIITTGGKYSTSRMLVDYVSDIYMPLCNLTNKYYNDIENVTRFNNWKELVLNKFNKIVITQENNIDNETIDAGKIIKETLQLEKV